jgi:hypothetical protein
MAVTDMAAPRDCRRTAGEAEVGGPQNWPEAFCRATSWSST